MSEDGDFREPHLRQGDFLGAFAVLESPEGILLVQNRRHIGGEEVLTWDLPGGQVEPGETLRAALDRELEEELGVCPGGATDFLFLQEGVRSLKKAPPYVWRSFFFRVESWNGDPAPGSEILAVRWARADQMSELLQAPYHGSFLDWLRGGGTYFSSSWVD